jgi:hypothetical protein
MLHLISEYKDIRPDDISSIKIHTQQQVPYGVGCKGRQALVFPQSQHPSRRHDENLDLLISFPNPSQLLFNNEYVSFKGFAEGGKRFRYEPLSEIRRRTHGQNNLGRDEVSDARLC